MSEQKNQGCCDTRKAGCCNFQWMRPNVDGQELIEVVRSAFMHLENTLRGVLPSSRESSLVWTNLEQACMWSTKSLVMTHQMVPDEVNDPIKEPETINVSAKE